MPETQKEQNPLKLKDKHNLCINIIKNNDKMQKRDWIVQINHQLNLGVPFVHSSIGPNNAQLLFACDVFRRRNHDVSLNIEPGVQAALVVHVIIHPSQSCREVTVSRTTTFSDIAQDIGTDIDKIRIRGCGTAIDTVLQYVGTLINNGWYVEKNMMNTLTQTSESYSQKNTTLQIVVRKGKCHT